jgi:hypothetical protein
MDRTDALIARLAEGLMPVTRLRPPLLRAGLWLAVAAVLGAALVFGFGRIDIFVRRAADPKLAVELAATLLTAVLAVISAFELSLPDRSKHWALLPLPPLALWIASSGYSCWRHWLKYGPDGWEAGESAHCFVWIVGFGIPLAIALMAALRRARPLAPLLPATVGGLGVAALAAFLLQFFHPFDVTFMDLGLHLAAVAVVVAATASPLKGLLR